MMDRRTSLIALAGAFVAADAMAQQATVRRIGFITSEGQSPMQAGFWDALVAGLQVHGWVESRNLVIERRYVQPGGEAALTAAAEDLARSGAEVIVVGSTRAALAAKRVTHTLPIVMASPADPVAVGLVASLARPGGNVTGLSWVATELAAKQLELLKEAVAGLTSVGVLANPANAATPIRIKEIVAAAHALKLQVDVVEAGSREELAAAFATMAKRGDGAALVVGDPLFNLEVSSLVRLAVQRRLPVMHFVREAVVEGALMSYGVSFIDLYRRAAGYVDKILRGAHPGDLPVEQASKFELAINLKTAKALGIKIPQSLLLRADEVIE